MPEFKPSSELDNSKDLGVLGANNDPLNATNLSIAINNNVSLCVDPYEASGAMNFGRTGSS